MSWTVPQPDLWAQRSACSPQNGGLIWASKGPPVRTGVCADEGRTFLGQEDMRTWKAAGLGAWWWWTAWGPKDRNGSADCAQQVARRHGQWCPTGKIPDSRRNSHFSAKETQAQKPKYFPLVISQWVGRCGSNTGQVTGRVTVFLPARPLDVTVTINWAVAPCSASCHRAHTYMHPQTVGHVSLSGKCPLTVHTPLDYPHDNLTELCGTPVQRASPWVWQPPWPWRWVLVLLVSFYIVGFRRRHLHPRSWEILVNSLRFLRWLFIWFWPQGAAGPLEWGRRYSLSFRPGRDGEDLVQFLP